MGFQINPMQFLKTGNLDLFFLNQKFDFKVDSKSHVVYLEFVQAKNALSFLADILDDN